MFKFSKNNKTFENYKLQLSTEITFYSDIETTILIYQIDARIKLHNMIWSKRGKSFLYPNSIFYITYRGFIGFDAPFSFYLLTVLFNRAIKEILVPPMVLYIYVQSVCILQKIIREEKRKVDVVHIFKKQQNIWKL